MPSGMSCWATIYLHFNVFLDKIEFDQDFENFVDKKLGFWVRVILHDHDTW
jgi:hypothetical protein